MDSTDYVLIRMSYNPNGAEVKNNVKQEDKENDKDMVDRIFKMQLSKQLAELNKVNFYGRPFQSYVLMDHKKGIPRANILGSNSTERI
ncbi:hypothetical protein AQUCO_02900081v1 [Aquilegia coerulea]|uniref:Uncharacterized protein n=1 Tax=Aquilegia coerulea TaxID=218851 RepID=A0A2G5D386_AQUCA|nr:hypothetical protein AQUCO_02900081v1 [Aquilegia coerulea]